MRHLHYWPLRSLCGWTAIVILLAGNSLVAAELLPFEKSFQSGSLEILKLLRESQCKTVGVLKFRVIKGKKPTFNAGTLNMRFAECLEAALNLQSQPAPPIQVVRNASRVAAQIAGADHLSDTGRELLFKRAYPLPSGTPVKVDAFVTGDVELASSLSRMTFNIILVHRDRKEQVFQFDAKTDGGIIAESGGSYVPRGSGGTFAEQAILAYREPRRFHPLAANPKVALLIFYDGKPIDPYFEHGEAMIPEPKQGQKVTLRLQRRDSSSDVLGVVLKVNGENTFFRQRLRDSDCRKWLLTPDWTQTEVAGFYMDDEAKQSTEEFEIASPEESKALETCYGADVGTISMSVFRATDPPPPDLSQEAEDLAAIARADFPTTTVQNADALRAQLRAAVTWLTSRGLMKGGLRVEGNVDWQDYYFEPEPIMAMSIRYYRPVNQ